MKERISPAAFELIVRFETGGRALYEKKLTHPDWPGGRSGVTIGFGYDLGYEEHLEADWEAYLDMDELHRLARCLGKTGSRARQALSGVRDITIAWDSAAEVFNERTLPQEIRKTLQVFPGSADKLPADAFGALVSVVFNRGTDLFGFRRSEMRSIRAITTTMDPLDPKEIQAIATEVRRMKRLWIDDLDSDGDLVDRREAEAVLIENSVA